MVNFPMVSSSNEIAALMTIPTQLILIFLILICGCSHENAKWKYQPLSESVIEVTFKNDPPYAYFLNAEGRTILPRSWFRTDPIKVQNAGKYYMNLTIDRPMKVNTNIAEEHYQIFVFPNDTTRVKLEFVEEGYQLEFVGSAANINNYLAEKSITTKSLNTQSFARRFLFSELEYGEFIRKTDSILEKEIEYLEQNKDRFSLSKKFERFEKAEIYFRGLEVKLDQGRYSGRHDRMGRFVPDYYPADDRYTQYLQSPELEIDEAVFSQSYFDYLTAFLRHQPEREGDFDMTGLERLERDMSLAGAFLEGKTYKLYKLSRFAQFISDLDEPRFVDSIASIYRIENYQPFINLRRNKRQERLIVMDTIPEFYFSDTQYNLYSLEYFKNNQLFIQFCDETVDSTGIGSLIFSKITENYIDHDDLKFIKIYMNVDTDQWLSRYSESVEEPKDFIVEGSWNRHLKELFGIEKMPFYIVMGKHNVLLLKRLEISLLIQDELDSLINEQNKALL